MDKCIRTPLFSHVLFVAFIVKTAVVIHNMDLNMKISNVYPKGIKFGEIFEFHEV